MPPPQPSPGVPGEGNDKAQERSCSLSRYSGGGLGRGLWATDKESDMVVTTTFTIEGYRIKQYLGVVRGIIVRAPTIAQGFLGGLKSIIGGRIGSYTEMCEQT